MTDLGVDPRLALLGLPVGLLVGVTGMGAGALMAPSLIFLFDVPAVVAVGTDLAFSAVTKSVAALHHWRRGNVDLGLALRLAAGSTPGALAAVTVTERFKAGWLADPELVIRKALGVLLILVGSVILWQLVHYIRGAGRPAAPAAAARRWLDVAVAAVIGFLVGLTSVGSGSLVVAWLGVAHVLPARVVVGTDLFNAFLLTATASLAHVQVGNVDPRLMANLLAGSVPGILLGTHLTVRVPNAALRGCLAVVLVAAGLSLIL